ncbi:DUF1080 domain-containing protein [Planctomycetaceae bacterium]|nr:DUF1080 domain-containing protein [Planctomycetaceae bacterium]
MGLCLCCFLVGCGTNGPAPEVASKATGPADSSAIAEKPETNRDRNPAEAVLASVPKVLLSRDQLEDGWVQLFDGETLFGWEANSDANWSVQDGMIHSNSGSPGLIVTTVPFSDYELLCDFKLEKGGNSGVFLRTPVTPENPAEDCYELNICDTHKAFQTASLVARKKGPPAVSVEGEWHTFHVTVEGPQVTVELDGKAVLEYTDQADEPLSVGRIGLQMNGGEVRFRNVFVKPLGSTAVFNGRDLNGWRVVPGGKSTFEVVDGVIHVQDGAGFLETENQWGDFVLQAEARTNGDGLNSGIFFRAEKGTEQSPSNGYELQIHNGIKPGSESVPDNAGTGAIFRRNTARFVAAKDHEWCCLTLLAFGPRMAVWVNGLQVTDWKDDRRDDPNPRRGRRLNPGHISLQGHDPTTNLDFRAIRVSELPASGSSGGASSRDGAK